MSSTSPSPPRPLGRRRTLRQSEARAAWAVSLPALLLLTVFLIVPFVLAFVLAFTDQRLIPNPRLPTEFVGLRNFRRILEDPTFQRALLNNFAFAAFVVPLQSALALGMAMLVNRRIRGSLVFRTIYFSPVVTTMVVVSAIWFLLYNPDEGFINAFLSAISFGTIPAIEWLQDTRTALLAIGILSVWQGVGFQMVIFLAGLQEIPVQLYEAARIDGANRVQTFWNITLPSLRNTTIFVIISTTILAFRLYDQVKIMTQGGPQNATQTVVYQIERVGFSQLRVGYASALTVVFFLIVLAVAMLQRRFLREERTVRE
ncbi:MAG: sugar ABC transporter permease [Trueperaceae bacterium]|nr:sugar ABC transporter permease [Trueperaceae bacterium]